MAINCNRSFDTTNPALFKFAIDKLPTVEFFSYSVNIPGITAGEIIQPTPIFDLKLPGDKMTFEPLVVNFIVNEDLSNFREIVNWMTGLYRPQTTEQYKALVTERPDLSHAANKYSIAHMYILTNKMNPIVDVVFYNVFPIALSPLTYDASISDPTPITTDATFNYTHYEIKSIS